MGGMRPLLVALAAAIAVSSPPAAGAGILRFGAGYSHAGGGFDGVTTGGYSVGAIPVLVDLFDTSYRLEAEEGELLFVDYELPVSDRLGVQFAIEGFETDLALRAVHDGREVDLETGNTRPFSRTTSYSGRIKVFPATVGLLYHPLRRPSADLYLGPVVGWIFSDDADYERPDRGSYNEGPVEVSDELVYGAVAGIDLPLDHSGWAFSGSVRYLRSNLRQETVPYVRWGHFALLYSDGTSRDLDLDAWVVHVGLGRRLGKR